MGAACFLVRDDGSVNVLPLPNAVRPPRAQRDEDGYYIKHEDVNAFEAKDVWMDEHTTAKDVSQPLRRKCPKASREFETRGTSVKRRLHRSSILQHTTKQRSSPLVALSARSCQRRKACEVEDENGHEQECMFQQKPCALY